MARWLRLLALLVGFVVALTVAPGHRPISGSLAHAAPSVLAGAEDQTAQGGAALPAASQSGLVPERDSLLGSYRVDPAPVVQGQVVHAAPADGAVGVSLTPTLSAVVVGVDSPTTYEFTLFTAVGKVASSPSDISNTWTVPAGVLQANTTYWWAVTGFDQTHNVIGSREPRWAFSTGAHVDAGPGVHLTAPVQASATPTTLVKLRWAFARTVVSVPVVAKVEIWQLDAQLVPSTQPVYTSDWLGGTELAVPEGKLDWDRRYRVRVTAAEQRDLTRTDRQSVSVVDFLTRVPWDQTRVRVDASPRHQQVSTATGAFTLQRGEASVASAGVPLAVVSSYRSNDRTDYALGAGWATLLDMRVEAGTDGVVHVRTADGHVETFGRSSDGGYVAARATTGQLKKLGDGLWEWGEGATRFVLDGQGLTKIVAPNNFETSINRNSSGRIGEVVDSRSGRRIALTWAGERVARMEARSADGAIVVGWDYEYDNNKLVKACSPQGHGARSCTSYAYTDPNNPTSVTSITDPAGAVTALRYSFAGQVSEVTDPVGPVTRFARTPRLGADGGFLGASVSVFNKDQKRLYGYRLNADARVVEQFTFRGDTRLSQTWEYDWKGRKTSYRGMDGAHQEWRYLAGSPDPGLMTEWRGPDQVVDHRFDHSSGRLVTIWDPRSEHTATRRELTRYTYAADVAGSNLAPGLLLSETDGSGGVTRYEYTRNTPAADGTGYAPDGLVAARTDPTGATIAYTYRRDGLVHTLTDALGAHTTMRYDALGRVIGRTLSADGTDQVSDIEVGDAGEILSVAGARVDDPVSGVSRQIKTSTTYDPAGRPTGVTSTNLLTGHAQTMTSSYDAAGRIIVNTAADGGTTTKVSYGPSGCVADSTDALGAQTRNECDDFGRITRSVQVGYHNPATPDPARDLTMHIVTYNNAGRVATSTDAAGITRTFDYTPDGMLARISRSVPGQEPVIEQKTTYDALGNPVRVDEYPGQAGLTATGITEYDTNARPVATWSRAEQTTTAHGPISAHTRRTTYSYDAAGRTTRTSLDDGTPAGTRRVDTATYNPGGLITTSSSGVSEASLVTTHYQYDQRGRRIGRTDPRAAAPGDPAWTTRYSFNAVDQPTTITYPAMQVTQPDATTSSATPVVRYGYDEFGRASTSIDPLGGVSSTEYDLNSRPSRQILPATAVADHPAPVRPTLSYTYNPAGQVTSVTNPAGATTTYTYDTAGNPVQVQAPPLTPGGPARVTNTTYTAAGLPATTTAPNGARTTVDYDPWARPVSVHLTADGQTRTSSLSYDAAGNRATSTTPAGGVTRYQYNNLGELVAVTDPDNRTLTIAGDLAGRPTRTRDDLGRTTVTAYNPDDQVTARSVSDPAGVVVSSTQASYDPAGNQLSARGPLGTGWSATYDALNHLTTHGTTPTSTSRFGYDLAGRRTAVTDPNQHSTYTSYTALRQPQTLTEPATGPGPLTDRQWATSYDLAGNPVTLTEPGGITRTRQFDTGGNLRTETGTGPTTAPAQRQYDYDPYGQLTAVNHPAGQQTFTYNGFGELTSSAGPAGATTLTYNPDGHLTERKDPSGTTTLTYTHAGQPATLTTSAGLNQTYHYDPAGRPTKIDLNNGLTRSLGYDAADRLTADTLTRTNGETLRNDTVTYDQAGRRDSVTRTPATLAGAGTNQYRYDADSRLTSWTDPAQATHTYTYDPAGNPTNIDGKAATYDARNRPLTLGDTTFTWSARGTQDSTTTAGLTTRRSWDALGRLTADGTTNYTYDGLDRIATADAKSFGYTATTAEPSRIGDTLLTRTADGASVIATGTDLLTPDPNRNITTRTTIDGTTTASRAYAPYGEVTHTQGNPMSPVGYQGQYTTDAGLTHMQARWYDAATHTFLSRDDTAGLPANQLNLYQYAGSDPLTNTDPTGRAWYDPIVDFVCSVFRGRCAPPPVLVVPAPPKAPAYSPPVYTPPPPSRDPGPVGTLTSNSNHSNGGGSGGSRGSGGSGGSGQCRYNCSRGSGSGYHGGSSGGGTSSYVKPRPLKPTDGYRPIDPHSKKIPHAEPPNSGPPERGYKPLDNTGASPGAVPPVQIPQQATTGPQPAPTPGNQPGPGLTPVPQAQTPGIATTGVGSDGAIRLPTRGDLREINNALHNPEFWQQTKQQAIQALSSPDFWVDVGIAVVSGVAVGAICAGTAGVGCAIMAGVTVGAATAGAGYAIKQSIHGQQINSATLATTMVAGGIGGGIGYAGSKALSAATGKLSLTRGGGHGYAANSGLTRVFRVEGPGNARLSIDDAGNVGIKGDQTLFLNFGDGARAQQFLSTRLAQGYEGTTIKSFDVPNSYVDRLRSRAVPERMARGSSVFQVDTKVTSGSFGLRSSEFEGLMCAVIPGSAC